MSFIPLIRSNFALPRVNAWSIVCWVSLLCAATVQGYATDTSWVYRMENADDCQWNVAHGTMATFSRDINPRNARSGASMKAQYCLGTDQGCAIKDDNFYSAWMKFKDFPVSNTYNTYMFWVKRDKLDPHNRDICPGFNIAGVARFDAPYILLTPADTIGRLVKIPLVCFRGFDDPKKQMPAGTCWEDCFGIGAHDTTKTGGVTRPTYSGKGTLWLDDMGFYYDPAFPAFPGPYVPYDQLVGVDKGPRLVLRPVVSQERFMVMNLHMRKVVEPGTWLFDLNGRRSLTGTSGNTENTGVFLIRRNAQP